MSIGTTSVTRTHAICMGHRVYGHEGHCANLHGHNYRFHFTVECKELDAVGRVIDFSVIKHTLCAWLEEHWDHKFLGWEDDDVMRALVGAAELGAARSTVASSFVLVPFNPTAENIVKHLVDVVGPRVLAGTGCELVAATVDETDKCSATYFKEWS